MARGRSLRTHDYELFQNTVHTFTPETPFRYHNGMIGVKPGTALSAAENEHLRQWWANATEVQPWYGHKLYYQGTPWGEWEPYVDYSLERSFSF